MYALSLLSVTCNKNEYENVRYALVQDSDCRAFCQCEHATTNLDGSVEYKWTKMDCPPGTQWNAVYGPGTCDHEINVNCAH